MLASYRLPLSFDPQRLKADLAKSAQHDWVSHFSKRHHNGGWEGVALRSSDGEVTTLTGRAADCEDTQLLRMCPYFREVISQFKCTTRRIRLLRLAAGAKIKEHVDFKTSYDHAFVRVHIPIETNPKVEFYVNGARVTMREGECWYVNVSCPHKIFNGGDSDRVHLVLDCEINDWLKSKFPASFGQQSKWRMVSYWLLWHKYKIRDRVALLFQDPALFFHK
jgi:Aspartyl/Asparaginyl beta-hydroxylase